MAAIRTCGYVINDPVNLIDPEGTNPFLIKEAIKKAIAMGAGAAAKYGRPLARRAKQIWDDTTIDGPYGTRICGIRYKKQPLARVYYGPYKGPKGKPRLHLHLKGREGEHIPIDPRDWFGW